MSPLRTCSSKGCEAMPSRVVNSIVSNSIVSSTQLDIDDEHIYLNKQGQFCLNEVHKLKIDNAIMKIAYYK